MAFVDEVRTRSGRFAVRVKHWESETPTEEATKTSLIFAFHSDAWVRHLRPRRSGTGIHRRHWDKARREG